MPTIFPPMFLAFVKMILIVCRLIVYTPISLSQASNSVRIPIGHIREKVWE